MRAKLAISCRASQRLGQTKVTFVVNLKFLSFLGVGHEVVNAGEVVGIEFVLVQLGLNGVVELRQVITGNHTIEDLQLMKVLRLLFAMLPIFRQLFFHSTNRSLESFDWILNIYYQFFRFFGFQCSCVRQKIPKNYINSFSRFMD